KDRLEKIPSLSYRQEGKFIHNERGELLDLSKLKLPIRDKRRLTWGYHIMHSKMEVIETSRGCTRACKFCSINHMYGRNFRTFPIERVLADLDDIYYNRKTRWIFIVDDNLVLNPKRVMQLCDALIRRKYKGLNLIVQADCVSMSRNEEMVRKMSLAGVRTVFLGIENVSEKNLAAIQKGNIVQASKKAVAICHKYGMMVIGGLVFGFPNDDEAAIIQNYEFFKATEADAAYFQTLTPYPKTQLREDLLNEGLVTNPDDYRWYNGVWANVRTKHLDSDQLHYLVWYHRQKVIGWWEPSDKAIKNGKLWTSIWRFAFRPVMQYFIRRTLRKHGWEGRYQREVRRLSSMNTYKDLEDVS
ncbi:MAG: B12-binding domain-containing radical SAM protein, partial [Desulfobacteraceae bacterium 4572_88]